MDAKKKIAGVIAAAAAIAFVTAPVASTVANAAGKKVPCYGVNSCKGKSQCKAGMDTCKGKNACKGKGVMMKKPAQCKKMNGSLEAPAADKQ